MKHNKKFKHNGNTNGNGGSGRRSNLQRVEVKFNVLAASSVAIAGTFDNWRPERSPLIPAADGRWAAELVLARGTYE